LVDCLQQSVQKREKVEELENKLLQLSLKTLEDDNQTGCRCYRVGSEEKFIYSQMVQLLLDYINSGAPQTHHTLLEKTFLWAKAAKQAIEKHEFVTK
jgi:hypothetical protein